ncbi:hypothetical protein B5M09_007102 [Aphanomyces astaci]|uniref:Uncharacterized protein n=1 Tax=Aphanomyces astaci TaxID=112090 RepID=A0A3R7WEE0_APHAT|nr:hypothetical protein B5M09_007102 [Aphanomyces astaci]
MARVTPLQLAAGLGHADVVALLKPVTSGFEQRDTLELISTEQARVATESAEPYQAPVSAKESDDIPTPSDIVDAVELAAQATATRLKDDGNKLFAQKKYVDSIDLYTEAIGLTPRDPLLYSNRCAALLAAGRAADALRDIRLAKVVRLKPDWPKALFREGQCLEALKRYEDAACAMWAAMQIAPDDKLIKKRFQNCVKRGREEFQASGAATSSP